MQTWLCNMCAALSMEVRHACLGLPATTARDQCHNGVQSSPPMPDQWTLLKGILLQAIDLQDHR